MRRATPPVVNEVGDVSRARRGPSLAVLGPAVVLAWATTAALLWLGLGRRLPAVWVTTTGVFTAWFIAHAVLWARRPDRDGWSLLPLLAFLAPLGTVLGATLAPGPGAPVFYSVLLIALAAALAAHVAMLRLGAAARAGAESLRRDEAMLRGGLWLWIALVWVASTVDQILRFALFLPTGHPEDTAFLWGCFQSWTAGGPMLSSWAAAWGHVGLRHYFGMHFSPIVLPVFAIVRLLPRLGTLLVIQNLFLAAGLLGWARVLSRQAREGRGETGGPGVTWALALLIAFPTLSATLRSEVHPLVWALPVAAALHGAWLRRARLGFLIAGAALFLFREDLGLLLAGYAPLSWLAGRRSRRDWFWLLAPLLGLVGSAVILFGVMPRYGTQAPEFFKEVFATPTAGLAPLLAWLLAHPAELARRVLRPAHLLLGLRLLVTGLAIPWGSWLWVTGVPLTALYALTARDIVMLRLDSHYALYGALFLVAAGFLSVWTWLRDRHPRRRLAVLVLLWAMAAAQPVRVDVPPLQDALHPGRSRAVVLADLKLLDLVRSAWVPPEVLFEVSPSRAVPAHWLVLGRLDPGRPGLPDGLLLPVQDPRGTSTWRLLSQKYRIEGPLARGARYEIYRLLPR